MVQTTLHVLSIMKEIRHEARSKSPEVGMKKKWYRHRLRPRRKALSLGTFLIRFWLQESASGQCLSDLSVLAHVHTCKRVAGPHKTETKEAPINRKPPTQAQNDAASVLSKSKGRKTFNGMEKL